MGISITQLMIVLVIVLVLFGTKRLRNLGGDLGTAIKGFRSAMKDGHDEATTPKEPEQLDKDEDETFEDHNFEESLKEHDKEDR